MAASDHLHPELFYETVDTGASRPLHRIQAKVEGRTAGSMVWNQREIRNIEVHPDFQRRGIATAMWNEGQRLAESSRIPSPKHSSDRTDAGDAWARSVGGRLPRRPVNED